MLLNHDGDFKAAAKELARQGYGEQRAKSAASRNTSISGKPHEMNGVGTDHAKQTQPPRPDDFCLGPLELKTGAARRTPSGAVRVQVVALLNGSVVYDFVLTPSPNT